MPVECCYHPAKAVVSKRDQITVLAQGGHLDAVVLGETEANRILGGSSVQHPQIASLGASQGLGAEQGGGWLRVAVLALLADRQPGSARV